MKILIVVPDTEVGGVSASAVNFSNELALRGHNVCFLDMSGDALCSDRLSESIEIRSLKGKSKLWNIGSGKVKRVGVLQKIGMLALGIIKKLTIRSGIWYKFIFSKFNKSPLA